MPAVLAHGDLLVFELCLACILLPAEQNKPPEEQIVQELSDAAPAFGLGFRTRLNKLYAHVVAMAFGASHRTISIVEFFIFYHNFDDAAMLPMAMINASA
jgi:hypothetical protein